MKINSFIIAFLLILLYSETCKSQYNSEIYSAYVSNKMDRWKIVIDNLEKTKEKSNEKILELINYQYGYIGYCVEYGRKDEAKKYLAQAEKNIETLEKANFQNSNINAYKSAFYGIRISLNAFSAPINGPKSLEYAKLALKQDSGNYMAWVQYGFGHFNMPAAFGGSKKVALDCFQKARSLLQKEPGQTVENWNYLNVLTLIADAYSELEDYNSARNIYESILRLEPGFLYVKDEKYPELLKKKK